MATLYERFLLPKLLKCACSAPPIAKQRQKVVPKAHGRVLELGIGMGLNLPFYDVDQVESVTGVDPALELRQIAEAAPRDPRLQVRVENGTAEALPFENGTFDSVVCTFTLCSVHTPAQALAEARRVLRPGGRFFYCEHGLSPDDDVARWQRRIEPVWKRLAGGCHLTRPVTRSVREAGFRVERSDAMYLPRAPRFAGWSEWGEAVVS